MPCTRIVRRVARAPISSVLSMPAFLCPALFRSPKPGLFFRSADLVKEQGQIIRRISGLRTGIQSGELAVGRGSADLALLPVSCPGCGAFVQTVEPHAAGFYSPRKTVKALKAQERVSRLPRSGMEDAIYEAALRNAGSALLQEMGLASSFTLANTPPSIRDSSTTPLCDRCHNLVHHHSGMPIYHPTIQSVQDTISESPHKFNHIYHVLDAADFPMSLIPNIHSLLSAEPQRPRNRRSKTGKFYKDKSTSLSFIITRSDLLAPTKEQVDSLMPYLIRILRESLGPAGSSVRLGNVKCVSSKRGWWTKDIKEDIWNRGGGNWMVGKANVGKSKLFEVVFPKGRSEEVKYSTLKTVAGRVGPDGVVPDGVRVCQGLVEELGRPMFDHIGPEEGSKQKATLNKASLLPPAQPETAFPVMPTVSPLPGTTASPIRHPFKKGRGELIDLPGISRGNLASYVREQNQAELAVCHRMRPKQHVLKPGQSLLLGGLIRITPTTTNLTFLACAFVPFREHVTSTEKAIGIQTQQRETGVPSIAKPGIGEKIASAGKFRLKWDVTKRRAGPITSPAAIGLKVDKLPYRILSTDILIEGCGWVEVVAQVRKRQLEQGITSLLDYGMTNGSAFGEGGPCGGEDIFPEIEVFSPEGGGIGARMPMNAWMMGVGSKKPVKRGRPRQSMKGAKKREIWKGREKLNHG